MKRERIDIRMDQETKTTIQKAASLVGVTISAFVIQKAFEAAQRILLQQEVLILNSEERNRLLELIDSPPKANKALKTLFRKNS